MGWPDTEEGRAARCAYLVEWRRKNRDKILGYSRGNSAKAKAARAAGTFDQRRIEYERKWAREKYQRDPAAGRAKAAAWRAKNPDKVREINRLSTLRKHGITPAQWDAMFDAQGGCCAICRTDDPRDRRGWHTDHDHKTGIVRGILCRHCNIMLGHAHDDPATLRASIAYLSQERT